MLVNNPMGSRRRRRFYHRAGVVPIPGALPKEDLPDPELFNYELEPFEYQEEEEFRPTSRVTESGKRSVNFITVTSLHSRLIDIVDSMIALAESEDQEQANAPGSKKDAKKGADKGADKEADKGAAMSVDQGVDQSVEGVDQGVDRGADQGITRNNAQDPDRCVAHSSKDMKE